ncbi:hypothetical protein HJG60_009831 [Phyllostomus discolor]|uniref:Uncharacterized protein n=1 Tax=Phyllostomus discolor TaxID=89673 RepID=A0A834B8B5_9CHIR|nr:hypothetical protein HJG60_009831 [Phyllostomus discolor]
MSEPQGHALSSKPVKGWPGSREGAWEPESQNPSPHRADWTWPQPAGLRPCTASGAPPCSPSIAPGYLLVSLPIMTLRTSRQPKPPNLSSPLPLRAPKPSNINSWCSYSVILHFFPRFCLGLFSKLTLHSI